MSQAKQNELNRIDRWPMIEIISHDHMMELMNKTLRWLWL